MSRSSGSIGAPRNAGVWLTLESWQQRQNIFPFDEPQVISTEHSALLQPFDVIGIGAKWIIGPVNDLRYGHNLEERRHGRRIRRLRGVIVEFCRCCGKPIRKFRSKLWRLGHQIESLDQIRHRAAGMRPDDVNVGVARGSPAENHLGDRARRVGPSLDGCIADVGQQVPATVGRIRVRIHHHPAAAKRLTGRSDRHCFL